MTESDLLYQRAKLEADLMNILGDVEDSVLEAVCEAVQDRFQILLDKLKG